MSSRTGPRGGEPPHDEFAEALRTSLPRLLLGLRRARPPARTQRDRLDHLERDLRETHTRINALFFAVITVALGDLVARVVAS